MTRRIRRLLLLTGAAVSALLAVGAVLLLAVGRSTPSSPLPNPNGYDDLLKAAHTVTRTTDNLAERDHDRLRALVMANDESVRLLRLGLSRQCVVPTDATIANFGAIGGDLVGLKQLAWALLLEGRLAEMESRPADAAQSYVDAIRLGTEMSRGGLMMNRLVGIACEGVGRNPLVKLLPNLMCEQIRPLVRDLEKIDGSTISWREVVKNENRFARAQAGNYPNPIKLLSDLWQARSVRKASEERHETAAAHVRLLAMELALLCYRCDQGRPPDSLQQLVPKYLQRVPSDPFSGHPLIYVPQGTNWLLYSVGPDRVDDGGSKSVGGQKNKGDLLYDSPW